MSILNERKYADFPERMSYNAKYPPSKADSKIQKGKIRLDFEILDFGEDNDFLSGWVSYFGMLMSLKNNTFPRSHKPMNVDPHVKPNLFTFSDGNEDAWVSTLDGLCWMKPA